MPRGEAVYVERAVIIEDHNAIIAHVMKLCVYERNPLVLACDDWKHRVGRVNVSQVKEGRDVLVVELVQRDQVGTRREDDRRHLDVQQ